MSRVSGAAAVAIPHSSRAEPAHWVISVWAGCPIDGERTSPTALPVADAPACPGRAERLGRRLRRALRRRDRLAKAPNGAQQDDRRASPTPRCPRRPDAAAGTASPQSRWSAYRRGVSWWRRREPLYEGPDWDKAAEIADRADTASHLGCGCASVGCLTPGVMAIAIVALVLVGCERITPGEPPGRAARPSRSRPLRRPCASSRPSNPSPA